MEANNVLLAQQAYDAAHTALHYIDDIKEDISAIKKEEKAIYSIASDLKLLTQTVAEMQENLGAIQNEQKQLNDKIDSIEQRPYQEYLDTKKEFKRSTISNIVKLFFEAVASIGGTIAVLYITGVIK